MNDFFEVLYCSTLSSQQSAQIVGTIVTQARERNAREQITGLLVFDGLRFCQHFEGPIDAVQALMARLGRDERHAEVLVLHKAGLAERRFKRFEMGLAQIEDAADIDKLQTLRGDAAMRHFMGLMPRLDISG